jgi:stage IV sporulation protein FB
MGGIRIFTLAGIPVKVSAWFFLILLFWLRGDVATGMTWAAAISVSILVHEFGHGFVARHYGLNPSIELHGWGGLCSHERADTDKQEALILIAGPGAGLVLGALVFIASKMVDPVLLAQSPFWSYFVRSMLYVNIGWSFVNLVPLWPLDGGQLFRLGLIRIMSPGPGERITHIVGTVLGLLGCYVGFVVMGSQFMGIIAAFLVWQNVQRINSNSASGAIRAKNTHAKGLIGQAREAYKAREWAAAERLAHQAKAESGLGPKELSELFEILGVSGAAQGHFEQAWSFLQRAPTQGNVYLAKVECVLALKLGSEAAALLDHKGVSQLPADVQQDLQALLPSHVS